MCVNVWASSDVRQAAVMHQEISLCIAYKWPSFLVVVVTNNMFQWWSFAMVCRRWRGCCLKLKRERWEPGERWRHWRENKVNPLSRLVITELCLYNDSKCEWGGWECEWGGVGRVWECEWGVCVEVHWECGWEWVGSVVGSGSGRVRVGAYREGWEWQLRGYIDYYIGRKVSVKKQPCCSAVGL